MMCTDSLWSVKRETGGYGVTITVSYVARAHVLREVPDTVQNNSFHCGNRNHAVAGWCSGHLVSARSRRDQLRKDELLLDKHILQTCDRLKDKDQVKEQERTREQMRAEGPEKPQHEKAERG